MTIFKYDNSTVMYADKAFGSISTTNNLYTVTFSEAADFTGTSGLGYKAYSSSGWADQAAMTTAVTAGTTFSISIVQLDGTSTTASPVKQIAIPMSTPTNPTLTAKLSVDQVS